MYADGGLAVDEGISALGGDDFAKAISYMNNSQEILEMLPDVEDKQNLANVCASIAMSLSNREDVDNALPLEQKAVDIFTRHPPENLYEKAHAHQALAQALTPKKRYAEVVEQIELNVAIKERLITTDHLGDCLSRTCRSLLLCRRQ